MILKTRTIGGEHIEDEMKGLQMRNSLYISRHFMMYVQRNQGNIVQALLRLCLLIVKEIIR